MTLSSPALRYVKALIPAIFLSLAASTSHATTILLNPNFETGSGQTSSSSLSAFPAPATGWSGWNNTAAPTTLEILPTTLPIGAAGNQMLHVQTTGYQNGIFQFMTSGSWYGGAWIYTLSGSAMFGVGSESGFSVVASTMLNQWEFVQIPTARTANEVIVYSNTLAGANFYVDLITVQSSPITPLQLESATPEPGTLALIGLGIGGLLIRRKQRA